jgi:hypothetical protein
MPDHLHRSVWTAYQQAGGDDRRATRATASSAFQLAVDVVLRHRPGVDARSACSEAARMIMMQPRWPSDRAPRGSIAPQYSPGHGGKPAQRLTWRRFPKSAS